MEKTVGNYSSVVGWVKFETVVPSQLQDTLVPTVKVD